MYKKVVESVRLYRYHEFKGGKMLNFTKLNKALTGIIEQADSAADEDVAKLKDIQLAQLFISTENLLSALENFTEKIDNEIATRGEIFIPETGQKLTIETESIIKINKMTKKEIKDLEKNEAEITAAPKKAPVKKKSTAKKAK